MINQEGDVLISQTHDGGDISISHGVVSMHGGLDTAVYLSLFGGNIADSKIKSDDYLQYWGNFIEGEEVYHYRSETQSLINSIPLTSSNLLRIESAIASDLAWLTENNIANNIDITLSVEGVNRLYIKILIQADGIKKDFNYTANWVNN